ncbi:short-chain dehydrogenase/reductase family 9C member 7 [Parasteatoda tepidariorum]|uniref:short-chain dehydrogenase/reductase family 9C member 7 n=1 Tax=Parasteatoda tepidariorum TaxID=114398 RepID=UPI00077FE397|nr:short-chain dehydrogenase/reductase family 9C member 7 [Parasteatoda tepidariorum]XP_042898158.1 short-chain dehydrogenase/reductase family 9C member 7 [Parasteatoda tepidariorum]
MFLFTLLIGGLTLLIWLLWSFWRQERRNQYLDAKERAIFISGCDTGIGHRLAIYFADLGCKVYAGCLDPEKAKGSLPDSVHIVPLDITNDESVRNAVELVTDSLKQNDQDLWALINNAGVCIFGLFEWQTWKQCETQIQVNVLGTMRLTKAFIPLLRKTKGRIITMTSVNGFLAYPSLSVYSASKFALEGLNNALRVELYDQYGIRVIIVQPGDYAKLTSIMSRHEQHANEMWENMSPEDQNSCGDFFHKYHRQAIKKSGLTSPISFEGCHLLLDMQEAVLSVDPRNKYLSTSFHLRMIYSFLALLPSFVIDFLFSKITNKILNS